MSSESLYWLLLWSLAVNYAILLTWFFVFVFGHGWVRRLHGRWFKLPDGSFDAIHYGAMAIYKVGILLFNLAPFIAVSLHTACEVRSQGSSPVQRKMGSAHSQSAGEGASPTAP